LRFCAQKGGILRGFCAKGGHFARILHGFVTVSQVYGRFHTYVHIQRNVYLERPPRTLSVPPRTRAQPGPRHPVPHSCRCLRRRASQAAAVAARETAAGGCSGEVVPRRSRSSSSARRANASRRGSPPPALPPAPTHARPPLAAITLLPTVFRQALSLCVRTLCALLLETIVSHARHDLRARHGMCV